jgi:hypothetical protein
MSEETSDTLPPPSETSRVLEVLDALSLRMAKSLGGLEVRLDRIEATQKRQSLDLERLDRIESTQNRQSMDLDLAMNALQQVLIELQLPNAAERIKAALARRHPKFDEGDVIAETPPNGTRQ